VVGHKIKIQKSVAFLCINSEHAEKKEIRKTISFTIFSIKTRNKPNQGGERHAQSKI
jgi:hypothetical protein